MTRTTRALLGAAFLAGAAPAGAQTYDFGQLCTTGSATGLTVCASATATFAANVLTVRVDNVQGPAGNYTANGAAHKITGIVIYYQGSGLAGGTFATGPTGFGNGVGNSFWGNGNGNSAGAGYSLLAAASTSQNAGGIIGCNAAGNPNATSTCGANPDALFTFTFGAGTVLPSSLGFGFRSQGINDGRGQDDSAKCYSTNGVGSNNPCLPPSVVPEPATVALTATGILGVFGLTRRRRRLAV